MEARATAKYLRMSPQKARLVVDLIRGKNAGEAINILKFTKKRASHEIEKVLRSAIANAANKDTEHPVDAETLVVRRAFADEGRPLKRIRPRARGAADRIKKRYCHLTVVVSGSDK